MNRTRKRKGEENTKIGGQPVGLTEGREDTSHDVLFPVMSIDAKVFHYSVNRNKKTRD